MLTSRKIPATILSLAMVAFGCRETTITGAPPGTTPPGTNPPGDVTCPGDTLTICDLKVASSPRHPAAEGPVQLTGLLVTTATHSLSEFMGQISVAGFFAQDPALKETFGGKWAGVVVTYRPDGVVGATPSVGDIVDVTGIFSEFGPDGAPKQQQVQASRITITGQGTPAAPVDVDSVESIGSGGADAAGYEGVLVRVKTVSVTNTAIVNGGSDYFGAFEVANSLIIGGEQYTYRNPVIGETFTSITGILRLGTRPWEAGLYILTPRVEGDVIAQNAAQVLRTIADIQDPNAPGAPLEMCRNTGSETTGKCARADLTNMVVTAVNGYVSTNLRAMWIQDPADTDGRFAGVKVVYNPSSVSYIPEVGQHVDVQGEVIDYRGGIQVQYPDVARNGTQTSSIAPTVVASLADVARASATSHAYEGVLIRIENVQVQDKCLQDTRGRDHGNWTVHRMGEDGTVMIGSGFGYDYNGDIRPSALQCFDGDGEPTGLCGCMNPNTGGSARPGDRRTAADQFRSITGIIDYAFGDYQLQVRGDFDLDKN